MVESDPPDGMPGPGINNVWYVYNESNTVFVFVHGIFSDSRSAWLYGGTSDRNEYWPELIRTDPNFDKPSIFLGGFYTAFDSGDYNIRDAANELYEALTISIDPASEALVKFPNVIFVTHSTGGIVVRHMLVRHASDFRDKKVGLVLIASPSVGSRDATRFNWLAGLAKQALGRELQWNHPFLEELDKDFKNLVHNRTIPGLIGAEAIENHFILKWLRFINKEVLVESSSAGRYFGEPIRLHNTDHFGAVKPYSKQHPVYRFLLGFYQNKFKPAVLTQLSVPKAEDAATSVQNHPNPIDSNGNIANVDVLNAAVVKDSNIQIQIGHSGVLRKDKSS
jgi:pimeloyl-ACP methyl ester carboxylesterase